jgi:3-deoxy-D-manno-octulosonic-acid transferase
MKSMLALILYRLLLPLLFLIAFPGWVIKMLKRGGFGTALNERVGIYFKEEEFEPSGAVHIHSISVGETALALKLLRAWSAEFPNTRFVLATGTSTGHELAANAGIPGVRVTYAPLDFAWMVLSYLNRFEPSRIVLIEGEIWPNLLRISEKRGIPVGLANARTSPRSARRMVKFAPALRPFFSKLSAVCIQENEHRELWQVLGIAPENIHLTGSLKFDPQSASPPPLSPAIEEMLAAFGAGRPVVIAASTFPGEEEMLARAISAADPLALPVIVPRHAERRTEVSQALSKAGFAVTLRSSFRQPLDSGKQAFVIDTTGELATWISHADAVIIGKSFLSVGGQNPAEAIIAGKPLILGPHMENFQPLARHLLTEGGALSAEDEDSVAAAIRKALDPCYSTDLIANATQVLSIHHGATQRHLSALHPSPASA